MITVEPASLRDLADIQNYFPRTEWKALVVQIARSCCVSLRDDDRVLAIAGLYEHDDHGELWIHFAPGLSSRKYLASQVIRRLLALARGLRRVTAIVRADCEAGLRLASLYGMRELDRPFEGYIRFVR
jgi:hypothetical protein